MRINGTFSHLLTVAAKRRRLYTFLFLLLYWPTCSIAQQVFSENFQDTILNPSWKIISGNWKVAGVQDMRIAPAENGYQYVLCAEGPGMVRLIVDIPDTIKATKLQLQFSYYTYSKGPAASAQIELHKRQQKDGTKGKPVTVNLPVKGRWIVVKKVLALPVGANSVYLVFSANKSSNTALKKLCFDVVQLSALK